MKTSAVTIRLDPKLEKLLDDVCEKTGRSRSEVVREALRRQLTLQLFEEARRKMIPFAEAQGKPAAEDQPVTVAVLRKVLREELHQ